MDILVAKESPTDDPFHDEAMFKSPSWTLAVRQRDQDVALFIDKTSAFPVSMGWPTGIRVFTARPNTHASLFEVPQDALWMDAEFIRDLARATPSKVALDDGIPVQAGMLPRYSVSHL